MVLREGLVVGLGNPLLDISAVVGKDLLEKYGLKADDAILAEDKHMPLFDEMVERYKVDYTAGGACQNSMRIIQWILRVPQVAVYLGAIGEDDQHSEVMKEKAKEIGLATRYQMVNGQKTGVCAVAITGTDRSLTTYLGAANFFTKSHLEIPENQDVLNSAQYFYISGFFLTVSPESIMTVAEHACTNNKVFMMNLSAAFICQIAQEPQMRAFPYVDIIFGNETEASIFAKEQKLASSSMKEIALQIAALPKVNKKRSRLVVITQGKDPVIVAKDGKVEEYPVETIDPSKIVDCNGAGDAFVGGFIAQLIQDKPYETCIKCGIWAGQAIICQSGVTLPDDLKFQE